jgi:GT2 family glycosyltransferase
MAAQHYPRVELLIAADGAAAAMEDEIAKLPVSVRFLPFDNPVFAAVAWNRAVREAFAELLVFVEPRDRFAPGALQTLVDASQRESEVAWVQGKGTTEPLRGALIRKSAFRKHGLFDPNPLLAGREQQSWLDRQPAAERSGSRIDIVTLNAASATAAPIPLARKIFMRVAEARLAQRPEPER